MNKKILFAVACAISMAVSGVAAKADVMNFSSSPGSDTFTATSISISNPGSAIVPTTGIFSGLLGGSVVFSPTTWTPGSGTETITVTNGAATDIIKITSFAFDPTNTGLNFNLTGSGTSQINGGALVNIAFALTSQITGGQSAGSPTSYSATVSTLVPLPGALVLFGSGLVGLAALGRRKRKQLEAAAA